MCWCRQACPSKLSYKLFICLFELHDPFHCFGQRTRELPCGRRGNFVGFHRQREHPVGNLHESSDGCCPSFCNLLASGCRSRKTVHDGKFPGTFLNPRFTSEVIYLISKMRFIISPRRLQCGCACETVSSPASALWIGIFAATHSSHPKLLQHAG